MLSSEPVIRPNRNTEYVYRVLHLLAKHEYTDLINWSSAGDNIQFWINCGDTFAYACADGEHINDEDLDALEKAIEDVRAADKFSFDGLELFVARKRNQRPMQCVLEDKPEKVRALFEELPE